MHIVYNEECFCEHCGELEPHTATYEDNNTYWCLSCGLVNNEITTEEADKAVQREILHKIKHFECRINNLKKLIK